MRTTTEFASAQGGARSALAPRARRTTRPTRNARRLKGDTVAVDCTWAGEGCGFLRDGESEVLFIRNTMRTPGIWAATSAGTRPHIVAIDCTFDQSVGGSKLKTTPQSSPVIDLVRCEWTGPQTQGFAVNIEGGLLRLTDSALPTNSRALPPGVIEG